MTEEITNTKKEEKQQVNIEALTGAGCETCPAHNRANLLKLGVDMNDWDYVLALAGNPNTGKSTVFNALTGLRQHTGNWPEKQSPAQKAGMNLAMPAIKLWTYLVRIPCWQPAWMNR